MNTKRIYIKVITLLIFISAVFVLCSCHIEESYKDFYIVDITDCAAEEYFTSSKLEFARAGNVVIIPEIKKINYSDYIIYISAYSPTGLEQVSVKDVSLLDDTTVFFNQDKDQDICFINNKKDLFDGYINSGVFTDADIDVVDGKMLYLIMHVQVDDGKQIITKEISYEIQIEGYMSLVTQT